MAGSVPWIVIVVIVVAVFAYGEWKEWRGERRGDAAGYQRAMPLLEKEAGRTRQEYLGIIRSLQWENERLKAVPAAKPLETNVVLQLPDGTEIRQKPVTRKAKES